MSSAANGGLLSLIIDASKGHVPANQKDCRAERRRLQKHGQDWFKSLAGGRELEGKIFDLGLWPALKKQLLPFCNAVRAAVGLDALDELPQ